MPSSPSEARRRGPARRRPPRAGRGRRRRAAEQRLGEVLADLGLQHAPRGEGPGEPRHDHLGHPELVGEEGRVHRSGPAERDEREVARLDPLLDRQRADRLGHLRVDHVADALGELLDRRARARPRAPRRLAAPRRSSVMLAAGERPVRSAQASGWHRSPSGGAAAAVARRARIGPRALRADAQAAGLRVRKRATPRADGVEVDDAHQQRQPLDRRLAGDVGLPVDHEADVEARPAHVDADEVRPLECPRERDPAHRPSDRPRQQRLHRPLPGRARRDDAAARLHDVEWYGEPAAASRTAAGRGRGG